MVRDEGGDRKGGVGERQIQRERECVCVRQRGEGGTVSTEKRKAVAKRGGCMHV